MEVKEAERQMSEEAGGRRPRSKRYGDKIRRVLSALRGHKRQHRVSDSIPSYHDTTDNCPLQHESVHRYSVRVARKKSRSNSAILATTTSKPQMTYPEDVTNLWPGARVSGNKIKLYLSSLEHDDDLQRGRDICGQVRAHDDLMSLERAIVRDTGVVDLHDDISSDNKSGQASPGRRISTLTDPNLLKPRNRRPLVEANDSNERQVVEAVQARRSRSRTRHSLLPVTWTFNDLRMEPQHLKVTPFRLGEGSYGLVMLGHYRGQRVAVKRILRQSRNDLEQELRMMHFLGDMDCTPSLVACDLSQEPYTVLTSYHGKSIFDCMGDSYLNRQLDWAQIITDSVTSICRIHDCGVVHGDLKEDNILLDNHDNRIKPIVIDFGLACFRDQARPMHIGPGETEKRRFMDKYPRVAPELVIHNLAPDFSTDAYAVGYMIQRVLRHVKVKRPSKFEKVAAKLVEKDLKLRISLHDALRQLQKSK